MLLIGQFRRVRTHPKVVPVGRWGSPLYASSQGIEVSKLQNRVCQDNHAVKSPI